MEYGDGAGSIIGFVAFAEQVFAQFTARQGREVALRPGGGGDVEPDPAAAVFMNVFSRLDQRRMRAAAMAAVDGAAIETAGLQLFLTCAPPGVGQGLECGLQGGALGKGGHGKQGCQDRPHDERTSQHEKSPGMTFTATNLLPSDKRREFENHSPYF